MCQFWQSFKTESLKRELSSSAEREFTDPGLERHRFEFLFDSKWPWMKKPTLNQAREEMKQGFPTRWYWWPGDKRNIRCDPSFTQLFSFKFCLTGFDFFATSQYFETWKLSMKWSCYSPVSFSKTPLWAQLPNLVEINNEYKATANFYRLINCTESFRAPM